MQPLTMAVTRKRRVRFAYPAQLRRQVLSSLAADASPQDIAKSSGIPLSTLYRWRKNPGSFRTQCTTANSIVPAANSLAVGSSAEPGHADSNRHYHFERTRARQSRAVLERLALSHKVIENRYFEQVNCDALAAIAKMSKCHFIRIYKQAFGESPHQHLIRRRADAALNLIGATLQPTALIASAVGFESTSSLVKAIKKFSAAGIPERVY